MQVLAEAVEDVVRRGQGRLLLVTGEAGIGKTTLVRAALERAQAGGAIVATGACWDAEAVPGYWPWVQVLRSLRLGTPDDLWEQARVVAGAGVGWLLADPSEGSSPRRAEVADRAVGSAFEALDAVATVLQVLSRERALVVALEDLHWADAASIELLRALVRHAALEPVLLLGTYRDDEVATSDHPRHLELADLAASASALPLGGLDVEAVAALLERAGVPSDPNGATRAAQADEVRRRTGGNPFFVEQLVGLWAAGAPTASAPPGVRAAIRRRLARLPGPTEELLAVAAIVGSRFEPAVLAGATGLDGDDIGRRLAPAATAHLIAPDPVGHRFVHDLVREALLDELEAGRARRLHAAIVRALGALPTDASADQATGGASVLATRRARHAVLAVPELPPAVAAALALEAADVASQRLAAEEAAGHLARALELLDGDDPTRPDLRVRLAVELRRAGRLTEARAELTALADAAAAGGDAESFAAAALGLHELGALVEDPEDDSLARLAEARDRLSAAAAAPVDARPGATRPAGTRLAGTGSEGPGPLLGRRARLQVLGARVLGAMARTRAHRLEDDRSGLVELGEQAVALARASDDDATLAFCLLAHHDVVWGTVGPARRRALVEEMEQAARRADDPEAELQALHLQFVALLELGDPAAFVALDRHEAAAEAAQLPRGRYLVRSRRTTVATLTGRFAEAEALGAEALALGARLGEVDRGSVAGDQRWELDRLRGDLDDLDALIAGLGGDPHRIVLELTVALDRGDLVRAEQLRRQVDELGRRWPRWARTIWLAVQVELATGRGDRARCEALRAEVAARPEAWIVLGGAVVVHGPVARLAGLLAVALERWEEAIGHFEAAAAAAARLDARPWVVDAQLGEVEARIGRSAPDDGIRAAALLASAGPEAAALGLAPAAVRAARLRARLARPPHGSSPGSSPGPVDGLLDALADTPAPARVPAGAAATAGGRFARVEDVWTITYGGRTVQVPDSKGLRDLHVLLGRPGVEVAAVELVGLDGAGLAEAGLAGGGLAGTGLGRTGLGRTGFDGTGGRHRLSGRGDAVLDDRARAAYRTRLTELDGQIERALAAHADGRAAELDTERAAILAELRAATGLGGRPRRLGDDRERARKAVTARIRDAIRRLEGRHPALAGHLRASVTTGTVCCYRPADAATWET